ncbi:MAG: YciI family protein [Actinomycetales bacterium]
MSIFAVEYVYTPDTAPQRDEHRPSHRSWLAGKVESGELLASGPFEDGSGALLLFKAAGEDELNALLKQDPFAEAGAIAGLKISGWTPGTGVLAQYL